MPLFDQIATFYSGTQGASNNTTPVTVVPDPGTGAPVFIIEPENLSVLNRDTVNATVILTLTAPSTIIERVTLTTGDKWTNNSKVIVGPGQTLTLELAGSVTTNQVTYNTAFFQVSG